MMAYNGYSELSFADGYYHIGFEGPGIVKIDENTPENIKMKFWEEWPKFHKKVVERQKKGIFDSRYPILPWDDPEENKKHYMR